MAYGSLADLALCAGVSVVLWTASMDDWMQLYWELLKDFGRETYRMWRYEMLLSALTVGFIFLVNRSEVDLRTGVKATAYALATMGIWHSVRAPWLFSKRTAESGTLSWAWGALGIGLCCFVVVLFVYTAAWFYTMQPPITLKMSPDGRDARIAQLESEIGSLRSFREPEDSLRRRTMRLGSELADFWANNPPPYYPGGAPNTGDPAKLRAYNEWQVKMERIYKEKYQQQLLGIIRAYKQEGVSTGFLEQSAENHAFGEFPYSGSGMQPPMCQQDEVCQFRELAWFVDARDRPVVTF